MFELIESHIGVITLQRPEALNAFNTHLVQALREDLDKATGCQSLRVLVITGAGEKAFSAGADLKERAGMTLDETRSFLTNLNRVFDSIEAFEFPTIAFMNGVAFGGGLELALACDIRIAHPRAQMGLTECSWGIIPGAGGTQRLPRLIGYPQAAELIFSAKRIDVEEALRLQLVNQIGESPLKFAHKIAACSDTSLKAAKQAMRTGDEPGAYEQVLKSADRLEGLKAFAEKRSPQF